MIRTLLQLFCIAGICQAVAGAADDLSSVRVDRLRCEARDAALNVDCADPRLSWILSSEEPGQRQTAYQALCATSPALLTPDKADLWDSGRVQSDQSIHIPYAGRPLRSNQRVFWTVRIWDRHGAPAPWAPPAEWTTAILDSADWAARWIASDRGEEVASPLAQTSWIWHGADSAGASASHAPPGKRLFRKAFRLPSAARLDDAWLYITADNGADCKINGQAVGGSDDWRHVAKIDVGGQLQADGENLIEVAAVNGGEQANPAGLAAALVVPVDGAADFVLVTDGSWHSAEQGETPQWTPARVVSSWGGAPWQAAGDAQLHPPLPIFRRAFSVQKPLQRALVHVTGLGHYKLRLNGQDVGDHFLDPAWSNYETTVYYNTFDVTSQLREGENVAGVLLGRSYYSTKGDRRLHGKLSDRPPALLMQLELQYADGTTARVVTDESWRWVAGPYVHDSLLGGVDYDAGKLPRGWDEAGFDDAAWTTARVINPQLGKLVAAASPPLRAFEEFQPDSINEPQPGRYVYDFGQNASATLRLAVSGPAGATLRLTYAEQRHGQSPHANDGKGLVDQSGIRSPNYFQYTLRGSDSGRPETWFCDVFYSGFQYVELAGAVPQGFPNPENKPVVVGLTSVHVRSSAPAIGQFSCDSAILEQIDRMIDWSVRSNLSHVLTDCPHREKMGWLEVVHLMWDSMANRYDLSRFGPKVCQDIRDAQRPDGKILTVAPDYGDFSNGFAYTPEWGAAGALIPWYVYQWYGDRRTLETNFDMMRRYVDYMRSTCQDGLVPAAGLGDWYDYVPGQNPGPAKLTPPELSAMAIFYDCTRVVADAAAVLQRAADEQTYRQLAADIRDDFNHRFYQGNGIYKNNGSCQTANAMALVTGLVEPQERQAVVRALVDDVESRNFQQTSGDVGFHYLVRALSDNGQAETLYRILRRTELGSYAYLVNHGWTSLPEAWDAHHQSSMNHCMLGHIQEFFTRTVAGIQPGAAGFKKVLIKPTPGPGVNAARASLDTPYGVVSSQWRLEDNRFALSVSIPPNTTARIELPNGEQAEAEPGDHRFNAVLKEPIPLER
ncbi:MAG: family 78 glycoside hydrolase catalytic domain [Pirellulales bacterium]|nr:family 78 glycoside hydrolase catalytic domain [Pirellulales bacterium]